MSISFQSGPRGGPGHLTRCRRSSTMVFECCDDGEKQCTMNHGMHMLTSDRNFSGPAKPTACRTRDRRRKEPEHPLVTRPRVSANE